VTFLVAAALAIGLLVTIPVAAHLLRRGRANEREFPPAALVPAQPPVARQRSRIEDRALLALRALLIVGLAVLGATPLVRCSRLSLSRPSGASVALALVIDDSLSMRATVDGESRWKRAIEGASQLLKSAREGDAIAIVLAGRPARLALAGTTDLGAARRALDELAQSDRSTDLAGAVQIARSALKHLPQVDKRIALFSDLAGARIPDGTPAPWLPLPVLERPVADCGVISGEQHGKRVTARVACSAAAAARGRVLEAISGKPEARPADAGKDAGRSGPSTPAGKVLAHAALAPRAGTQTVQLDLPVSVPIAELELKGDDALEHDDRAPVTARSSALEVAVVTDVSTGSVTTGGPTILEQALSALDSGSVTRPLALVPDDEHELEPFAALILDDPAGLSPESRSALAKWLRHGGVAMALLGPRAETVQLGVTLEPFATGAVHWETPPGSTSIAAKTLSWLGSEGSSLDKLHPKGRARLDGAEPAGARVGARWEDSRPFILDRRVGRGLVLSVGLPSSASESDFALRPGFLALLDHAIQQALKRSGPRQSLAGATWSFSTHAVSIEGPDGPVPAREPGGSEATDDDAAPAKVAVVEVLGRYRVKTDGETHTRIVTLDPAEITTRPTKPGRALRAAAGGTGRTQVDASPGVALALLGLLALELLLRLAGPLGRRRRRGAGAAARPT